MGRSAESFKRNFSDSEARVEAYLPVGRGLPALGVWRFGGGVSGFGRGSPSSFENRNCWGPSSFQAIALIGEPS